MRAPRGALACAIVILLAWASPSSAQDKIRVTLSSVKEQYVVREPVKFTVVMENVSSEPLHIPEVQYFSDMNMEYLFLSIAGPIGEEERRYKWIYVNGIPAPDYPGEILAPGSRIQFFLYPNVTYRSNGLAIVGPTRLTFSEPGEYSVRLCYSVPPVERVLYMPESRRIYSNVITLTFRAPDESEKEILDALWSGNPRGLLLGETENFMMSDVPSLERVLKEYPGHWLEPHVLFALGRSYASLVGQGVWVSNPERAAPFLERLIRQYPSFRREEVRLRLGVVYARIGERTKGSALMAEVLEENPLLRTNEAFMADYLAVSKGIEASNEWRKSRKADPVAEKRE